MKLENKPNMPVPECGQGSPLQGMQATVFEQDLPRCRFVQCAQDMQKGALPGSGRTYHTYYFTPAYIQVYPL